MALQLVITNAGRAAVIDQAKGGFRAVRIAAVGVSPTAITAAPAATALADEVKRITTIAGEATATDVTHLTVTDESGDSYTVRSFALYLSDGTLFALYGQADAIVQKSAQALLLLAIDVTLSSTPAAQLTFGNANFTNPAATTERAGVVELATSAETEDLADQRRAVTPGGLASTLARYAKLAGARFTGLVRMVAGAEITSDKDALLTISTPKASYAIGAVAGTDALIVRDMQSGADCLSLTATAAAFAGKVAARAGFYADDYCYLTVPVATLADVSFDTGDVLRYTRNINQYDFLIGSSSALSISANQLYRAGNRIWDAANDGAGSGLDADLLDGRHAAEFALLAGADFTGKVTVAGSLGLGVANPYSPLHLRRADQGEARITLENAATGGRAWQLVAGVHNVSQGDFSIFDASAGVTRLTIDPAGVVRFSGALAWTGANDGAGSGLDADLLDGREASDFALLSGATFTGAVTGKSGLFADTFCYLAIPAAGLADVSFDTGDVLRFTRSINQYDFLIGSNSALSITAGQLSRAGNRVWDAANDGAGSGLDADLLDGWERDAVRDWGNLLNRPAAFPPAAHTHGAADLTGAFTGTLSDNGYTVLPNGLIVQWVTGAQQLAGSETTQTVTFPIAFNACFQVIAATQVANADSESHAVYQLVSFTTESATVMRQLVNTAGADRQPSWPRLVAIGR